MAFDLTGLYGVNCNATKSFLLYKAFLLALLNHYVYNNQGNLTINRKTQYILS